jgi:HAD superfamily hydrolase (TIGR01484 family)
LYTIRESVKSVKEITGIEPKQFIITARATAESKKVYDLIKKLDKEKELYSIWVGYEVHEIGHKSVSKGNTVKKLMKMLKLKKENVLTIGDSTNDIDMVKQGGIQISADTKIIKAPYWINKKAILPKHPADILLDYLLANL